VASLYSDFNNYVGAIGQNVGSLLGAFTDPTPPADTSVIVLSGMPLPGIVQSEEIRQRINWERVPIEGRSGTVKLYHGFEDADLRYTLKLTGDDEDGGIAGAVGDLLSGDLAGFAEGVQENAAGGSYPLSAVQKLEWLQSFFKGFDAKAVKPRVYQISQEMANAAGIKEVVFDSVEPLRRSGSDLVEVSIAFLEYEPATVLMDTGQAAPPDEPEVPSPDTTDPF